MDLAAIALQGIDQAQVQLEAAATGIANAGAQSGDAATVDLSTEVVALFSASNQFDVGLATLKTAGEIQRIAVNLLA